MSRKRKAPQPDESASGQPQEWLMPIGRRLALARRSIGGVSQEMAGAAIGVTGAAWSQWERGIWPPQVDALIYISKRSRAPIDWILRGEIFASLPSDVAQKVLPIQEFWEIFPEQRARASRK